MNHTNFTINSRKFKKNIFLYITTSMVFCCFQSEATQDDPIELVSNLDGQNSVIGSGSTELQSLGAADRRSSYNARKQRHMAGNTGSGGVIFDPVAPIVAIGNKCEWCY